MLARQPARELLASLARTQEAHGGRMVKARSDRADEKEENREWPTISGVLLFAGPVNLKQSKVSTSTPETTTKSRLHTSFPPSRPFRVECRRFDQRCLGTSLILEDILTAK